MCVVPENIHTVISFGSLLRPFLEFEISDCMDALCEIGIFWWTILRRKDFGRDKAFGHKGEGFGGLHPRLWIFYEAQFVAGIEHY